MKNAEVARTRHSAERKRPLAIAFFTMIVFSVFFVSRSVFAVGGDKIAKIASATELTIAVAGNFSEPIKILSHRFEAETGTIVIMSFGSTGKHYTQIKNGAPFDIFFAADKKHPELLEKEGLVVSGSRFTYAIGKVVLWSPEPSLVDASGDILSKGDFKFLAIANPRLAPYGKAAQEVLTARKDWNKLSSRFVQGKDITQTFQFVQSKNAELGFIAYSQIKKPGKTIAGSFWDIPQNLYTPIEQQVVLLKDSKTARAFITFISSTESKKIIREYGYSLP
jgi:molybdate transport system substrate-binding protein